VDAGGFTVAGMNALSQVTDLASAAPLTISYQDLTDLRARIRGEALIPSDPGYAKARVPFNRMHADRPALAVLAAGTADVVAAVDFARGLGVEISVRGGGHSIAGLSSSDGGMVLDLSPMNAVDVDLDAGVVHVQGGALLGDVDHETQAFGLATPLGTVSDTGVAGLALGGGYGWLRRKYGLTCDNLVSARVVCADGRVRTASADDNPDLFWALRGGGGNFGVVTSFTFRLHPVGPLVAFAGVFYPLGEAAGVLRRFRDWVRTAPDDVTPGAIVFGTKMPAAAELPEPIHGEKVLAVTGVHAGAADEGIAILQPLRELGTALADISQVLPFTAVQTAFDGFFPRGQLQSYWKSTYLDELPDGAIDVMVETARDRSPGRSEFELAYFEVFPMGGAVSRVDPAATAFSERVASYLIATNGSWCDATENDDQIRWVREASSRVGAFGRGATYLNFGANTDNAVVAEALGANLQRLAQVKTQYDPRNLFRRNNNILPG
jgi:FAD/FMN-containing dehydrogenase